MMLEHVYEIRGPEDQLPALAQKFREEGTEVFSDKPLIATCAVVQIMQLMLQRHEPDSSAPEQWVVQRIANDPVEYRNRRKAMN